VILDGSGTVLMGGQRVGWVDRRPPEEQRPELHGGVALHVTNGDIVHDPTRVWHQVVLESGAAATFMLINVNEPESRAHGRGSKRTGPDAPSVHLPIRLPSSPGRFVLTPGSRVSRPIRRGKGGGRCR
jgi:hypothetical protein